MRTRVYLMLLALGAGSLRAQQFSIPQPSERELHRVNFHRVTSKGSPAPEPGAENTALPSPLVRTDGSRVRTADEWNQSRRPELVKAWTGILGKIDPAPEDMKWFGDIRQATVQQKRDMEGYTRIDLDLPMEKDFLQRHLLLLPKGQGEGPFPAVIAWTSSTPGLQGAGRMVGNLSRPPRICSSDGLVIHPELSPGNAISSRPRNLYTNVSAIGWGMGKMVHDVTFPRNPNTFAASRR